MNLVMHIIRFKGLMNLHKTLDNKFVMVTGEKMESTASDDKAFYRTVYLSGQIPNSGKHE